MLRRAPLAVNRKPLADRPENVLPEAVGMDLDPRRRILEILTASLDALGGDSPASDRPDFVDRTMARLKEGAIQPDAVPLVHVQALGRRDTGVY